MRESPSPHGRTITAATQGTLRRAAIRSALAAAAIAAATAVLHSGISPRYEAQATVLVTAPEGKGGAGLMAAQSSIISSTGVLAHVAADLGLERRPGFAVAAAWPARMLEAFGLRRGGGGLSGAQNALERLGAGLDVRAVDQAGLVAIRFSSRRADLAAAIPNAIADRYVTLLQAARQQAELSSPEAAAAVAGRPQAAGETAAAQARPAEIEAEIGRLGRELEVAEARARTLRAALGKMAALRTNPDMQAADLAAPYLEREARLRSELARLSATLLGNHPRIRALNAQLADARSELLSAARNVLGDIEAELAALEARKVDATAALRASRSATDAAGTPEGEAAAPGAGTAEARRALDATVGAQRDAAVLRRDFLPASARVFQRAAVPADPASLGSAVVAGAAFAAAFALLLGLSLGRGRRRNMHGNGPEMAQAIDDLSMPSPSRAVPHDDLAALRDMEWQSSATSPAQGDGLAAAEPDVQPVRRTFDGIDAVRAARELISDGAMRAIFVSAEGDAGPEASVRVAREVADAGLRTVLLDLTASGAVSRQMLGGPRRAGITDLLVAEAQFSDVIHSDPISACNVIPTGTADPVRAMRAAERLPIILDSLASAYDLVVVECGAADAASVSRLAAEGTVVLLSAVQPSDELVGLALEFLDKGLGWPLVVLAGGIGAPLPLQRSAA